MGWSRRNFVKMFDADKTRMIGLPYVDKLWRYRNVTDGQFCYINIARQYADAR